MRTRAPQNRGGCVQAGPVRFSRREPPWRTMFAATVSAGCKRLAARLPQHPPFGTPVAAHSVRHKTAAPCTANPPPCSGALCATKPRGMRSGRPGTFLAQGTTMANNVRRYGLSRLQVRHKMQTCAPQNADQFAAKPRRGHVPAGPVRPSPDERPWRTMFAATVSAGCKHLAARLPQHPPFGIRPRPCSGAQRAPQNRGPVRREPADLIFV